MSGLIKVGLIGNGIQSKRIQKILNNKKIKYLIYKPNNTKYYDKDDYKKLNNCKIIFLLTPNKSHFEYLNKFNGTKYIFCEKPPTNIKNQLNKIKNFDYKKIYFNYNFRFSKISKILSNCKKYKLGKLIYASITASHGLALLDKYKKNWRSDIKKCPRGVYELVSTHYVDLVNFLFDIKEIKKPLLINNSKKGDSFDTALVEIKLKANGIINIFATYCSSYMKKLEFLFENGIITQKNNLIQIRGPSKSFDKKNFFKYPKVISSFKISDTKDYNKSLEDSVNFFLKTSFSGKKFKKKLFDKSIKSNEYLLN